MNLIRRTFEATLLWCFLFHATVALASGPTSEQESIIRLAKGRFPLVLTKDGRSLVYVDRENRLHRRLIDDPKSESVVTLPGSVTQISASATGEKVAFVSSDFACVGLITFANNNDPAKNQDAQVRWILSRDRKDGHSAIGCQRSHSPSAEESVQFGNPFQWRVGGNSIALSNDGRYIAIGIADRNIQIIDVESEKKSLDIPTGEAEIMKIRFIDNDTKLFVVQAELGERWEGTASKSDMQFAVWDLKLGELSNFYHTDTVGMLLDYDLLWDFSEETGALWSINTSGLIWDEKSNERMSINLNSIDIKTCVGVSPRGLSIPLGENDAWLEFLADPKGRWIAYTTSQGLIVRDSRSGAILAEWNDEMALRSLVSSPDGLRIFAITGGVVSSDVTNDALDQVVYSDGGEIREFPLKLKLVGNAFNLKNDSSKGQASTTCLIEDEKSSARDFVNLNSKFSLIWSMPINWAEDDWHLNRDGSLWVDRKTKVQQLDLGLGKVNLTLPTPRSDQVKSVLDFERKQFINWEGDTLSLRPLRKKYLNKDKRILVRRIGWSAERVVVIGERFGVVWTDNRANSLDEKSPSEGSALAIIYDGSGREISVEKGVENGGRGYFQSINEDYGEDIFDGARARLDSIGNYQWEKSYLGSVRARTLKKTIKTKDASPQSHGTAFWHGFRSSNHASMRKNGDHIHTGGYQVVGLSGNFGARIIANGIALYDGKNRQQVAFISIRNVQALSFDYLRRILLVETSSEDDEVHKLFAFKVSK